MEKRELESARGSDSDRPSIQLKPKLVPEARGQRSVKERTELQILDLRKRAFKYTVVSSSAILFAILAITMLQGFRLWGFDLPKEILYALLVATIGKAAESVLIVMRFLFGPGPSGE